MQILKIKEKAESRVDGSFYFWHSTFVKYQGNARFQNQPWGMEQNTAGIQSQVSYKANPRMCLCV